MSSLYTPEEIEAIFEEYADALKRGETISEDLAERFTDAQKGVKNYTKQMDDSLKQLRGSFLSLGGAMLEGKQGAGQYNDIVGKGADAVANFASQFGILGMVIGAVVKAATAYVTAVNKQSDALYKSFQDLNKVGAAGAGGMSEIFDNMQKMGYGIEQLGEMTSLIKENSATLAHFGGTAVDGTKALANLSDQIVHSDLGTKFMNMGMTIDDINKGGASYIKLQASMGRNSKDVGDQLSAGTAEYMTQLTMLSKITGDTREAQQAKIDAAMSDEAVNQVMTELQQRIARVGPGGDKAAENQLKKIETLMASDMPEEMKKAMLGAMGGDAAAANKVFMTMPNAFKMLTDSSVSTNEFMDQTVTDISNTLDKMGGSAKVHAFGETFGDMKQLREYVAGGQWSARMKSAEANLVATDKATTAQTDLRVSQMNTRDAMQSMINAGIVPVTESMAKLAEVTNGVAGIGGAKTPIGGWSQNQADFKGAVISGGGGKGSAVAVDQEMAAFGGGETPQPEPKVTAKPAPPPNPVPAPTPTAPPPKPPVEEKKPELPKEPPKEEKKPVPVTIAMTPDQKSSSAQKLEDATTKLAAVTSSTAVNKKSAYEQEMARLDEQEATAKKQLADRRAAAIAARSVNPNEKIDADLARQDQETKNISATAKTPKNFTPENMQTMMSDQISTAKKMIGDQLDQASSLANNKKNGYATGGVATGPSSGYQTTLHGTEAVVPLPDGNSIPVEMPESNTVIAEQTQILAQQLQRFDELISVLRNQVSVSNKILQQSK